MLIEKMRRASEDAASSADVFRVYQAETRGDPSDGLLVMSLVRGFGVPIPAAMKALRWTGFGFRDGLDDDELDRLVGRWVLPAAAPPGSPRPAGPEQPG